MAHRAGERSEHWMLREAEEEVARRKYEESDRVLGYVRLQKETRETRGPELGPFRDHHWERRQQAQRWANRDGRPYSFAPTSDELYYCGHRWSDEYGGMVPIAMDGRIMTEWMVGL